MTSNDGVWAEVPPEHVEHPFITDAYGQPLKFEWVVREPCPVCGVGLCAFSDPRPDVNRTVRAHCSRCDYEAPRARVEVEVIKCGT
jgi:hypothetical protein